MSKNTPLSDTLLSLISNQKAKTEFEELVGQEYANMCQDSDLPYTVWEFSCALTMVANKEHWKNPIDAEICQSDRCIVERATINATGSIPVFTERTNGRLQVQAIGYYAAIGA